LQYSKINFAAESIFNSTKVGSGVLARVVSLETLLKMKREAGRAQDLIDIEELQRIR
jgi:hypothetical protein